MADCQRASQGQLLEDPDLASLVLPLLSLRALAALQCTSKGVLCVVAGQEAPWQARPPLLVALTVAAVPDSLCMHMQAAARREHPAHHPVLDASCVQAYCRRRHAAVATVCTGQATSQLLAHGSGAVSPGFARQAVLVGRSVQLRALAGGQLLGVCALPDVPGSFCPDTTWGLSMYGRQVVLPFGTSWSYAGREEASEATASGLIFLDLDLMRTKVHHLEAAPHSRSTALCSFHPDGDLVLVLQQDRQDRQVLSVFTCSGILISDMVGNLQGRGSLIPSEPRCWSPGILGSPLMICLRRGDDLLLCRLTTGAPLQQVCAAIGCTAWATPFTGRLMALCGNIIFNIVSLGSTGHFFWQPLHVIPDLGTVRRVAWGVRVVCFD